MPLTSDLTIVQSKFAPAAASSQAKLLNANLKNMDASTPGWWAIGAERYRQMRMNGETSLAKPTILSQGIDIAVPSRHHNRSIPCRMFLPQGISSTKQCRGIFVHIHGGGWVLMSEKTVDPLLQAYANATSCAAISIGYRLAPENPFPAAVNDCIDAATFLDDNKEDYGGPIRYMGGESAGAHLTLLTAFHMLRTRQKFQLSGGLLLHFGFFDLSLLPRSINVPDAPVLNREMINHFVEAFVPGLEVAQRKDASISPFYEDLERYRVDGQGSRLPRAFFSCGTADCLLEDSVMMGLRWSMAGGEAIVKLYEGAPHGFIGFSADVLPEAGVALADALLFIQEEPNGGNKIQSPGE